MTRQKAVKYLVSVGNGLMTIKAIYKIPTKYETVISFVRELKSMRIPAMASC